MTVEAGELVVRIVGNASTLSRSVESEVGKATRSVGKLGRSLGLAFGGAAVISGVTKTLNLAKNFDLTMRQVGVQTGQTGDQLQRMSDLALKMGQDTVYSAQDAGDAMLELSKGGLTAAQIKSGALKTAMTLAAAGGLELADSAAAVVNGMGAFNISADQAKRVAVALAGAANASSADVSDMTQALAQAGAQASATGLTIEDASAALAIFANNGVKGSDAGTSLKTMLQNLIPTTATQQQLMQDLGLSFVDAHGNFVDLEQIAGRLQKSMQGLSQAQRVQALRTLFGSDASRAALFLYKAGAKGVRDMTKATHDQSTVQKMAQTAMEGASGAWENFTGSLETAAIRLGTKALPVLTELLNWGSDAIGNADQWGPALQNAFDGVLDSVQLLWPVIREGAKLAADLAGAFGDLPGPLQSMAAQAAIALLVMPRLAAGVTSVTASVTTNIARLQQWRAELTYSATRAQATAAAMQRLAGAAKAAAGVGGMIALSAAAGETNSSLKFLESTAAGALLGFSIGGPVGGAIGAGAGALYGLATATSSAAVEMVDAKADAKAFAATLDQVTGAVTRATRAQTLDTMAKRYGDQWTQMVQQGHQLGITTRDLVGYVLGEEAATKRLNGAIHDNIDSRNGSKRAAAQMLDLQRQFLRGDREEADQARRTTKQRIADTTSWRDALKGFPKGVKVALKQEGYAPNMRQIKALAKQYDLQPRQVRTIMRLVGADKVNADAKRTKRALEDTGKAKADLSPFQRSVLDGLSKAERRATFGTADLNKIIKQTTGKARANLDPFVAALGADMSGAATTANRGGNRIGSELKSGALSGIGGLAALLSGQVAAAVNAAIAAGRHAADSHSPSRKMIALGKDMTKGGAIGVAANALLMVDAARKAVRDTHRAAVKELLGSKKLGAYFAKHLVDGMVGSTSHVRNAAQKLADLVGNAYDKRSKERDERRHHLEGVLHAKKSTDLEKQRAKRELAALKAADRHDKAQQRAAMQLIHAQQAASVKLARAWDKNHQQLTAAREAVKQLQQQQYDYAKSVADAMVGAANITADMPEGVATTVQSITERMRKQLAQAQDFARNIAALTAAGLDKGYIDQLVQAGVEGGGLEAQQLAGASADQIAELNKLMQQLAGTGAVLGAHVGDYLYGAGVREAEAYVKELERKQDRIEKIMRRAARSFADELRDALDNIKAKGSGSGNKSKVATAARTTVAQGASVTPIDLSGMTITNPAPEPASVSVATRLRRLGQTGVLIPTYPPGAISA